MTFVVEISKIGVDVLSAPNPNTRIFSSRYNNFKIIAEGTISTSVTAGTNKQVTLTHGLSFIPLPAAFVKVSGETQAYPPNGYGVVVATSKSLITNNFLFNYVQADATTVYFNFDNNTGASKTISIRYLLLEAIT